MLALLIGSAWALALPTYSGPDEQTHVTKAAAVVRGQLHGRDTETELGTITVVRVPAVLADRPAGPAKACFSGFGDRPATCAHRLSGGTQEVDAVTYVGRYPPLYYAVVGLPSLVAPGPVTPLLMRLVSVVLGAALLASALSSAALAARRSRLLLGVLVAVTPMVSYLLGVVNPNGIEVVGALSAATAVASLDRAAPAHHRTLVRRAAVGFAACALSRTPSIAFAVLAVGLAWVSLPTDQRPRARDLPGLRWAAAAVAAAAALAIGWAGWLAAAGVGEALTRESVATSAGESGRFVRQVVGVFGELDTPLPLALWVAWLVLVAVLVVVGLIRGRARQRLALAVAVVATAVVPVIAQALAVPPVGARWQGRYGLPLAVLVPVIAAAAIRPRRRDQPWVVAVLAVVAVVQVGAVATVARRYRVGTDGPVWYLGHAGWRPAGVSAALLALAALAWVVTVARVAHVGAPGEGPAPGAVSGP